MFEKRHVNISIANKNYSCIFKFFLVIVHWLRRNLLRYSSFRRPADNDWIFDKTLVSFFSTFVSEYIISADVEYEMVKVAFFHTKPDVQLWSRKLCTNILYWLFNILSYSKLCTYFKLPSLWLEFFFLTAFVFSDLIFVLF